MQKVIITYTGEGVCALNATGYDRIQLCKGEKFEFDHPLYFKAFKQAVNALKDQGIMDIEHSASDGQAHEAHVCDALWVDPDAVVAEEKVVEEVVDTEEVSTEPAKKEKKSKE